MNWTRTLPDNYSTDYHTAYMVQHLPDPTSESAYLREGTSFRDSAYSLGKWARFNSEGCKYEWCLLSEYWAGGQPLSVANGQSNVLLESSLKAAQDHIAKLNGKIAKAKEALS